MTTSSETSEKKSTLCAIAALLGAAAFLVYRLWPDALHNFDGVIFSAVISERELEWEQELWRYASHFLYNPAAWLFFRLLRFFGFDLPGFVVMQLLGAGLGALTVGGLFLLLREITRDLRDAFPLALLAAAGAHFWMRATECSVYMPSLFLTGAVFALAWAYHRTESRAALAGLSVAAGLAALFHLANVFWFPAVAVFVWLKRRRDAAIFLGASGLLAAVPQILCFDVYSLEAFRAWYLRQGDVGLSAWGLKSGLNWRFPWKEHLEGLAQVFWASPNGVPRAYVLAALVAAGLLGWALVRAWRRAPSLKEDRPFLIFLGLFTLCILVFQSFWATEMTKYTPLTFPAVLAAAVLFRAAGPGAAPRGALLAAALLTLGYNLVAGIRPRHAVESNRDILMAHAIGENTEKGAIIVMSGMVHPYAKVYVPLIAKRKRLSLDLFFLEYPKGRAAEELRRILLDATANAVPIYLLSEVIEGKFLPCPPEWGFEKADLARLLKGFQFHVRAELGPDARLYRLWPDDAAPDLWRKFAFHSAGTWGAIYPLEKLAAGPDAHAGVWHELGRTWSAVRDDHAAFAIWEEGLRRFPGYKPMIEDLARTLVRHKQEDKLAPFLRRHLSEPEAREAESHLLTKPQK